MKVDMIYGLLNSSYLPTFLLQEVKTQAYDAKCNNEGWEDFLRRVPCPEGHLCPDEDNPANVVSGSQLTYAIQDINNPRSGLAYLQVVD